MACCSRRKRAAHWIRRNSSGSSKKIAAAAGLPAAKRHPHVLKHSLASHLIAGNVNLALVQQCLGHRSINSTMAYVHAQDEQAAEAAQRALMALY